MDGIGVLAAVSGTRDPRSFQAWLRRTDIRSAFRGLLGGPWDGARPVSWTLAPLLDVRGRLPDFADLRIEPLEIADAWRSAVTAASAWEPNAVTTLEVEGGPLPLGSLEALMELLAPRHAPLAAVVADRMLGSGNEFHWPVRIAIAPGPSHTELADRLRRDLELHHPSFLDVVEFVSPAGPHEAVDILVAAGALGRVIADLAGVQRGIDAHTLLVLGELGDARSMTASALRDALRDSVDPWAIAVVDVPNERIDEWFSELIRQLSHDLTLEHALRVMASENATGLPFVVAEPRALAAMSARSVAERTIESLPVVESRDVVELPELPRDSFSVPAGRWSRGVLLNAIRDRGAFGLERMGASATSALNRWVEGRGALANGAPTGAEPPEPVPGNPPRGPRRGRERPRYLQANVTPSRGADENPLVEPLAPSTAYVLNVRVGLPSRRWARGQTRVSLGELERDGRRHRLRVVFDQSGEYECQIGTVDLPPAGSSSPCQFDFVSSADGRLRGRLILVYRNRVLQTALVTASRRGARVRVETVVRPALNGLSSRRAFDLALVHNHDDDGETRYTAISGDWTVARQANIEKDVDAIRSFLTDAAKSARRHSGLGSPATVDLLVKLARRGHSLRKLVIMEGDPEGLGDPDRAPRLQVVSANADAFFPVELFYDFPPPQPTSAKLCGNAAAALVGGRCIPETYHGQLAPDGTLGVVCPAGFWSMNRVIERYATPRGLIKNLRNHDFGVRSDPVGQRDRLGDLSNALFACSSLVTPTDAKKVSDALASVPNGKPSTAATWQVWLDTIKAIGPGLLVLLSHTDIDKRLKETALIIAQAEKCFSTTFGRPYVRDALLPDDTADSRPGPVVFLLGCDTTRAWTEYQSFVTLFRENHAALVVGTVGSVAARHAPDVAAKLIKQLGSRAATSAGVRPETFGEVLLTARQQLLMDGEVMALALSSYGDADWRFA